MSKYAPCSPLKRICISAAWLLAAVLLPPAGLEAKESANDPLPTTAQFDPVPHYKLAVQLTKDQKYERALDELKLALEQNPQYYDARYQMGVVNQIVGRLDDAKKWYSELLDNRPDYLPARINLGSVYRQQNDLPAAEQEFQKAIAQDYYSFQAHYNLANLMVAEGKPTEGLKEFKACLKLAPDNAMAHNNIGVLFDQRGYYEEARDEFTKASHLDPASKMFLENLDLANQHLSKAKAAKRKGPQTL